MRNAAQAPGPAAGLSNQRLIEGLLVLAVFATAATMPMQNDSWWHLRTGQIIWAHKALPRHDLFSFIIPPDYPWHNHEWLAQVLMYGIYSVGGVVLLTLVGAALATAALVPTLALTPGRPLHRAALVFMAVPLVRVGWAVRPQLFSLALFALTLWLVVRGRSLLLPFIFLLWANLHGGVALGGVLLVGSLLSALLFGPPGPAGGSTPPGPERRRRLIRLAVATALCGAATLCTPLGLHILLFPLEGTRRSRASGNEEFLSPGLHSVGGICFWVVAALFCFLLITRFRQLRTSNGRLLAVLATLLLPMAITSMRTVPHFLLVAVPAMAGLAPPLSSSRSPAPEQPRRNLGIALLGLALATAFVVYAFVRPLPRLGWHPMPAAAIAAVRAAPPPTYNTYDDGGFLIWFVPERKVFVDSREYTYPPELLLPALSTYRTGDYEALFARYGFRSAVVRPGDRVGARLLRGGWHSLYADDKWLVLAGPRRDNAR